MPAIRNDNEQIDKAAEAGQHATNEVSRMARAVTEEAVEAGEQASRAGADLARRGVETTRETLESGLDTTVQSFQRVTDQFTQVLGFAGPQAEELARRSSQNIEAVSQAGTVLARGAQEISREWFGLAQDRLAKDLNALNRLAGCRSVQDFVAVQSDIVRDRLELAVESGRRMAEVSVRVADEAARIIRAQADRNAAVFERGAGHARRAA
jgi:phasin family protein